MGYRGASLKGGHDMMTAEDVVKRISPAECAFLDQGVTSAAWASFAVLGSYT